MSFQPPYKQCPICDSDRISPELKIHYWREYPLDFFACSTCGAHFANPMPSTEVISRGNDALVKWYHRDRVFEHEVRDARQAYLRGRMLAGRLKRWQPRGRMLDLGCYNGFLPLGVRDFSDWEVEGLEISSELSEFVEGKLGVRCHNGTLEELKLPEASYDFILCHDLIEHINQPGEFLAEIARVLRPGGRIQIITPNAIQDLAFSKRAWRAGMPMTMLLNHIMMFSPEALRRALERAGLAVEQLYCYDVRHALKDFGVWGLNPPRDIPEGPRMSEALELPVRDLLSQWTPELVDEIRRHKKTSAAYGFVRETLPKALRLRVPARLGVGHEIYALAGKR